MLQNLHYWILRQGQISVWDGLVIKYCVRELDDLQRSLLTFSPAMFLQVPVLGLWMTYALYLLSREFRAFLCNTVWGISVRIISPDKLLYQFAYTAYKTDVMLLVGSLDAIHFPLHLIFSYCLSFHQLPAGNWCSSVLPSPLLYITANFDPLTLKDY